MDAGGSIIDFCMEQTTASRDRHSEAAIEEATIGTNRRLDRGKAYEWMKEHCHQRMLNRRRKRI